MSMNSVCLISKSWRPSSFRREKNSLEEQIECESQLLPAILEASKWQQLRKQSTTGINELDERIGGKKVNRWRMEGHEKDGGLVHNGEIRRNGWEKKDE